MGYLSVHCALLSVVEETIQADPMITLVGIFFVSFHLDGDIPGVVMQIDGVFDAISTCFYLLDLVNVYNFFFKSLYLNIRLEGKREKFL